MAIRYSVRQNRLLGQPGKHAAMVRPLYTADLEQVIEQMAWRGGSVAAIRGVLELFFATVEDMVAEGVNVNTPLANFHLSVQGTFDSPADRFDPRRHRIVPRVTPGRRLRKTVRRKARVERRFRAGPRPNPLTYVDLDSGERNSTLTPGSIGRVVGSRLRFDPNDPRQGIFFVAEDRRAVPAGTVAMNRPKQLIFLVPPLPPGSYTLEVRATADDSNEVRAGQLGRRLTVAVATAEADLAQWEAAGPAACPEAKDSAPLSKGSLPFDQR